MRSLTTKPGLWTRVRRFFGASVPGVGSAFRVGVGAGLGISREVYGVFQAYRENPWFHLGHDRLAQDRAKSLRWRLYRGPPGDPARELLPAQHPLLDLLRAPVRFDNGQILSANHRWKVLALHYALAGEWFLWKQRVLPRGVSALVPISPLSVRELPTSEDRFFHVDLGSVGLQKISPEDMIWCRDPDPLVPYGRGVGIGRTLGDELDTDEGAAHHQKASLLNHGIPSGLVVVPGLSPEEKDALQLSWSEKFGGPDRAGRIEFARGEGGVEYVKLGDETLFSSTTELRSWLRDTFLQTAGVSPELVGINDGGTRDSAYVAAHNLARGQVEPWQIATCDAIQSQLLSEYEDPARVFLECDSALPEDLDLKLRAIATAPSAFRVRDLRAVGGFPPDLDRGDESLIDEPTLTPGQIPPAPDERRKKETK